MSHRAKHQVILMSTVLILLIVGGGAFYFIAVNSPFQPVKKTILVINPGGTGQTKIADTWIDGNVTTDSGTSSLKSTTQIIYLPQSPLTSNPTINNQGQLAFGVKVVTYSFPDVAKFFGVQTEVLLYQANITVQVVASQVDGNAIYKINSPSSIVTGFTFQTQGQVQVPLSGITDITSELKARNAPYGTYVIKVTSIESWSLWTYNVVIGSSLLQIITCWIWPSNPICFALHQVQGPKTTTFTEQAGPYTYGAVNTPTFLMAMPTDPIVVGTVSGQTKVFQLAFIPAGGFTGTVQVSFTGMPTGMTITCQDPGCNNVPLPAPPVSYKVTVTSQTQLGNYTITATGTSGSITRQGTFVVQVIQNGSPVQCPPICNQANTVLAADVSQSSYAPYGVVTIHGSLTVTNGQPVNAGEIDVTDASTHNILTKVASGSDGKFTATFLASGTSGDYSVLVSYPGDQRYLPSSVTVTYSVNNLPPYTLYIIIAIIAILIVVAIFGFVYMRKKPGMP